MAAAFQVGAFQTGAFQQVEGNVTSTLVLRLPVDCVLAGEQLFSDRYREYDIAPQRTSTRTRVRSGGRHRLSGQAPSFKTTSTSRGYD